ncbi:MAG: hypothetical protein ACFFCO_05220, partial [Promethearchaeota archaeon]
GAMLHYLLISQRESGVLLFERVAPSFRDISPVMMSGLMSALNKTAKLLQIGELTSFEAYHFKVVLSATGNISVVLVIDKGDVESDWRECAITIAKLFEAAYDLGKGEPLNGSQFQSFNGTLDQVLADMGWKIGFVGVLDTDLAQFLIVYDSRLKTIYQLGEVSAPESLVQRVQSLAENQEATILEGENTLHLVRREDTGGVLAFTQRSRDIERKRLSKMVSFLVGDLHSRFWFRPSLQKAAEALFKASEIDAVMKVDGHSLLQILQENAAPLRVLELLRRFNIRSLLKATAPEE